MELGFAHATCADLRPQDTSAWLAEVLIGLPHASSQQGRGTRLENGARRTAAPIPVRHRHRQLPDWAEGGDVDGRAELLGAQKDSKAPATQGGWRHLVRVRVRGSRSRGRGMLRASRQGGRRHLDKVQGAADKGDRGRGVAQRARRRAEPLEKTRDVLAWLGRRRLVGGEALEVAEREGHARLA